MTAISRRATIPGVTHHRADINGARLHYVSAGAAAPRSCSPTGGRSRGGPSAS